MHQATRLKLDMQMTIHYYYVSLPTSKENAFVKGHKKYYSVFENLNSIKLAEVQLPFFIRAEVQNEILTQTSRCKSR